MTDATYTHLALVLDRSGSMGYIATDMNGGVEELLKEQAAQPGKILVDVTTFDTTIEKPYAGVKPEEIKHPLIHPRGGTALFDAVGQTVVSLGERLKAMDEAARPGKVIVVIVTDGEENASREWVKEGLQKLIKRQQDDYSWEFIFLGANIDSAAVGGGFGIRKGATMNYAPTGAGATFATSTASAYITRSRMGDVADLADISVSTS
jgi:uncharacterized protein YegL